MRKASADVWRWFFPKQIIVPDCVIQLLEFVYPTINWDRVSFHDGWPHVLGFSPKRAITLPDTYWPHRIRIYFKPDQWNPCECSGLGIIVHEGFHVLQIQDILGGWGLGLARPFTLLYLACWAGKGFSYERHPMEADAYVVAGRSTSLYEGCCSSARLPCDSSTNPPSLKAEGLEAFAANCQSVVQTSRGLIFWKELADSTPGLMALYEAAQGLFMKGRRLKVSIPLRWVARPLSLIGTGILYIIFSLYYVAWMMIWTIVTIAAWVLKVAVELIGLILTQVLLAVTKILCAFDGFTL
jgi:hypothetical protein